MDGAEFNGAQLPLFDKYGTAALSSISQSVRPDQGVTCAKYEKNSVVTALGLSTCHSWRAIQTMI